MNKRNFKFYLTTPQSLDVALGWSVSDAGFISSSFDASKAAIKYTELKGDGVFVDLHFTDPYSAVFFYDKQRRPLGSKKQLNSNEAIIAPEGSKYFTMRFTLFDPEVRAALTSATTKVVNQAYRVTPYYKSLSYKYAKESGQEYYRESLEGSLKLVGKDFDLVYNQELNSPFSLFVYLNKQVYFRGTFIKTDCKFDFAKKICEPKIKTKDAYENILEYYDDKYDLVKMKLPLSSIECTKRPFMQIYRLGASTVTNVFNGQAWETEVSASIDSANELAGTQFSELRYLREIYIEEAKLPEVNGIYTKYRLEQKEDDEHVIITYHRWYKVVEGAQTHYIELARSYAQGQLSAGVYRVSDGKRLYYVSDIADVPLGMFNTRSNLTGLDFTSESSDNFVIKKDISYDIYGRIVHNNTDTGEALDSNDFAMSNVSYKRATPLEVQVSDISQSSDSTTESTIYGINDYGEYFTPEFLLNPPSGSKYLPIIRSSWANTSIWLVYNSSLIGTRDDQRYSLRDCFSIGHVIKGLLNKMGSSVTHEPSPEYSSFLYAKAQPLNGIDRFHVYITQKSNAIRGSYDQAAQKAEVSLKSIMEMLRDCFRCYWYIDNGKLKIEHVSFFKNGLSYAPANSYTDLTLFTEGFNNKPILYGQSALEYDTSELLREYSFAYADESQVPFSGVKLEVDAPYVSKVENINVGEFSADLDYMQISADSISQDGFALLCPRDVPVVDGPRKLETPILRMRLIDDGHPYNVTVQNGYASWAYLVKLYAFDMPGEHAKSNVLESFEAKGIKDNLLQTITVPAIQGLTPYSAVKTSLGIARIKGVNEHLESGHLDLDLAYPLR